MTRNLTPAVRLGRHIRAELQFKSADLWVGVYWCDLGSSWDAWVCLVPCLPIHLYSVEE